jgi:transposase
MFKIPKQEYTAEFKDLAVKRVKSGEALSRVARELGLVEQTLRNWVKAAKNGKLNPPGGKAVTPEQMELSRVRAENARLKMENEILKKGQYPGALGQRVDAHVVLVVVDEAGKHVPDGAHLVCGGVGHLEGSLRRRGHAFDVAVHPRQPPRVGDVVGGKKQVALTHVTCLSKRRFVPGEEVTVPRRPGEGRGGADFCSPV